MDLSPAESKIPLCILVDSSNVTCWKSSFVILRVLHYFVTFILFLMENPVSSVDPDQTPHYVASDLGLPCFMGFPVRMG